MRKVAARELLALAPAEPLLHTLNAKLADTTTHRTAVAAVKELTRPHPKLGLAPGSPRLPPCSSIQ